MKFDDFDRAIDRGARTWLGSPSGTPRTNDKPVFRSPLEVVAEVRPLAPVIQIEQLRARREARRVHPHRPTGGAA